MRKIAVTALILSTLLLGDTRAIGTKEAFAECRVRLEKFMELNVKNAEVAFTSVLAMTLLARTSDEIKNPDDAIKVFLNMLMAQCVESLRGEERI